MRHGLLLILASPAAYADQTACEDVFERCNQTVPQGFASTGNPLFYPLPISAVFDLMQQAGIADASSPSSALSPASIYDDPTTATAKEALLQYFSFRDMGRYDACAEIPASHWCSVGLFGSLSLGQCLPEACDAMDYLRSVQCAANMSINTVIDLSSREPALANLTLGLLQLEALVPYLTMKSATNYCEDDVQPNLLDGGTLCMLLLIGLLVGAVVCATTRSCAGRATADALGAFCALANTRSLFRTRGAEEEGRELAFFNGVRVLSTFSVVLGHCFLELVSSASNMAPTGYAFINSFYMQLVTGIMLSVDTFFWMSGFMAAFIMSLRMRPTNDLTPPCAVALGGLRQTVGAVLHRFVRLTPVYAFTLFFYLYIFPSVGAGSGPTWTLMQQSPQLDYCRSNWWTNLLYVSNIAGPDKYKGTGSCMGWSWYLANDFQFFVVLALVMPFYHRHRRAVLVFLGLALASSIVANATQTALHDINIGTDPHESAFLYAFPWTRSGPYVVGVLFGLYYAAFMQKPSPKTSPQQEARLESDVATAELLDSVRGGRRANRWQQLLWGCSVLLIFAVYLLPYADNSAGGALDPKRALWPLWFRAAWNGLERPLWAIGLSGFAHFVMVAPDATASPISAALGNNVRSFLSLATWEVLAKLSYGAYLWHLMGILLINGTRHQWPLFSMSNVFLLYVPVLVGAYFFAAISYYLVEKPCINIENRLKKRSRSKPARPVDVAPSLPPPELLIEPLVVPSPAVPPAPAPSAS